MRSPGFIRSTSTCQISKMEAFWTIISTILNTYIYIHIYIMRSIGTIIVQTMRQTFLKYPNHIKFMFGFIISRFLLMNKQLNNIYIYTYTHTYTPTYTHTYTHTYLQIQCTYIYILSTVYRFTGLPYFTGLLPRSQIYQIWLSKEVNNHHCFPLCHHLLSGNSI